MRGALRFPLGAPLPAAPKSIRTAGDWHGRPLRAGQASAAPGSYTPSSSPNVADRREMVDPSLARMLARSIRSIGSVKRGLAIGRSPGVTANRVATAPSISVSFCARNVSAATR